jgi:hypothetical protein
MAKYQNVIPESISSEKSGYGQQLTEQDLIRILIDNSESKTEYHHTQVKLCMRIWSGYTKFIRSQCNKDRIIDSIYFGSFFKKDTAPSMLGGFEGEKVLGPGNTYALVNDCKKYNTFAEFKTVNNSENYQRVPASCAAKEEVSVNMKAIAQVCNCTADQISSFLSRLRELAFNTAFTKKKQISLNFSIGQLWIQPSQTIEFKSIGYFDSASQMAAPVPSSIGDVRSQYLDDKSRASRENSIFNTQNSQKNKIASLLRRDEGETNNYSHLSDFLKSHIYRSKDKMINKHLSSRENDDAYSHISKKNKYNN